MQLPRPWPDADLADRGRIDRDEHDVAAGLARERAKPQVGQQVLQNAAQPSQERKHEHACNKDMRSISLHARPPRPFLVCCSTIPDPAADGHLALPPATVPTPARVSVSAAAW